MDKKQAAEFLGVSTRTIENYAKEGKISVTYIPDKNGKRAEYKESELQRLKEELQTPIHRSVVAPNGIEIADSEVFGGLAKLPSTRIAELLEAISQAQGVALLWNKLVWDLDEAATASGYSRYRLRSAIALGALKAKKVGRGWKVRPQDLREYTNWLFGDDNEEADQNRNRMAGIRN
ncbi:helix-turn-helix domain-containing protein [Nostoc sp. CENA67]|uniref:Helix-turn-helix domain-containing protein n=1 Tax=Amazonocrinis nigriterrae CENA67 TaxID=2794033 RepID=A0A8J7LCF5_9NOST|nr:helix-turn-helix domain-containing protein [Amazonocrinis nigriterrae]MBH8566740.1 helix-turn-helix domain-containing protein [Amazonocrinis nigriterrae CENA67]